MEEKENKAGVFALICSVLCPLVGITCYFVNKKDVVNPSAYLVAAGIGFFIGFILRAAAGTL